MSHDDPASSPLAFEAFLKVMGPKMKRLLATYRVPVEDAEDVLQQALLALVYQWGTVRDAEGWLLGTLRRHCLMYWRTHRRRLYSAVDSAILEWLSQPLAPPQERSDLLADLRSMIGRLPPRCRTLLELRFQLGYEPSEVARHLGYRDKSIGKVTNRCLAALAREMLAAAVLPASGAIAEAAALHEPAEARAEAAGGTPPPTPPPERAAPRRVRGAPPADRPLPAGGGRKPPAAVTSGGERRDFLDTSPSAPRSSRSHRTHSS
jgi:RNA polymerase sigma factor (sigma-70 family)